MNKDIRVVANLVATYDLSPAGADSVQAIDYLCIYEYEYNGKKYKYRTHQRDNFSPIPEIIYLGFMKDPNKVYRVESLEHSVRKNSSSNNSSDGILWKVGIFLVIFFAVIFSVAIQGLKESKGSIFFVIIFICFLVITISIKSKRKIKTKDEIRDEMIEDAILNNRIVTAHLVKSNYLGLVNPESSTLSSFYKQYPYKAKYVYEYNGKKYTKIIHCMGTPPRTKTLYLNKNLKDFIC